MTTAVALLALGVAASDLNDYWPGAMPWNYKIGYAKMPDKMCSMGDEVEVSFGLGLVKPAPGSGSDPAPLYMHQCYYKCSNGCTGDGVKDVVAEDGTSYKLPCFCSGMESTDTIATFSVCGDVAVLKAACDASPECKGFHKVKGQSRGFLLKDGCQEEALAGLGDSTSLDYYAKMDPETAGGDGCPLGLAVLAYGMMDLTMSCPELAEGKEQYNPVTDKQFGTGCSSILWSGNGCGWLVQAPPAPAPGIITDISDCGAATCVNHLYEANWIFGFEGADYDEEICKRTEPWLKDGYCTNALWKALCPQECPDVDCAMCESWLNDNDEAATVLTEMLGLDSTSGACAALMDGNMCADPVVMVTCMSTCSGDGRRLSAETEAHLTSARHVYGTHFRQMLSAMEEKLFAAGGRRLDSHPVSLYGSWDPTSPPDICSDMAKSAVAPANYDILDTTSFYDWYSWLDPNNKYALDIKPECPDQPTYATVSYKYCDNNNLNIMGLDVSEAIYEQITDDLCWKKCATGATGTFCDGFDPAFNAFSNALCVPRSTCEDYCDKLGAACAGFEMHKAVPRCYLITDVCFGDEVVPEEAAVMYDQVTKTEGPFRYYTHYNLNCGLTAEAAPVIAPTVGRREECEEMCNAEMDCAGFDYTPATEACAFRSISRTGFVPGAYCSGGSMTFASVTPTYYTLAPMAGTHYVEKMLNGVSVEEPWSPPCKAVLSDPQGYGYLPGTALGAYERELATNCGAPQQDVVCYMSPTKSHRLVWGGQAKFAGSMMYLESTTGIPRSCSGWVLEEETGAGYEPMYTTYLGEGIDCPGPCVDTPDFDDGYGYSCADWNGDWNFDGVIDCLEEQDAVFNIPSGYTKAEMDAIRAACPATCTACKENTAPGPAGYSLNVPDGYVGMYSWKPMVDPYVSTFFVCKSYPMCGTLQTCVLAKNRFYSEVAILLTTETVTASPHGFISDTPSYEELLDPETFRPKTLISVEMAILFVAKVKAQFGKELYRNVPGHLRIKIASLGAGVSSAVIKMVSAAGTTIFGKSYSIPEQSTTPTGYEPWYTDVVRVEMFGPKGVPDAGAVTIDFYAPTAPNLMVIGFEKDGTEMVRLPGSIVPGSPGYWRVSVTKAGDYIGTTESPCPAIPFGATNPKPANSEDGLKCPDVDAGAECAVICKATYIPSGIMTCNLGVWSTVTCDPVPGYDAEKQFFRLSHRSRLDYGWRIRKIMAFTDAACTNAINANEIAITGPSESYLNSYPAEAGTKSIRTSNLNDETACLGAAGNCHDFWSKGLNVNPYPVDETHGGAAFVDFTIESDQSVQCVQVVSRTLTGTPASPTPRQYFPEEMTLHRGFYAEPGSDEPLEHSMIAKLGWTNFWTATASESEQKPEGLYTTFTTSCGMKNTRIFGELLNRVPSMPSACHCKQYCIDEIENGCVSWNYYVPTKECIIQSSIKAVPEETCEESLDYISGDTGLRIDGIKPTMVAPGATFDLTVMGTNLPTTASAVLQETTPPRQRIKIVEKGAVCAEAEVSEFVDGIGCSHPYFCAPKPSETSAVEATWTGLKIFAADTDKFYDVCYNKGLTYDRYEWFKVGDVFVPKTPFVFTTEPKEISRTSPTFTVKVERDELGEFSDMADWKLKLVKSYFDCDKSSDAKLPFDNTDDKVEVSASTCSWGPIMLYFPPHSFGDVGDYKVCFAKDGVNYEQIPSKAGDVYLEIAALEEDSSHARAVYSYQTLSGKTDAENTFVLKGNDLYLPSESGLGFFGGKTCNGTAVFKAKVDEVASTADGYVFKGAVPDIEKGEYTMCYCDDQMATTANGTSDESKYIVEQDYVCGMGLAFSELTAEAVEDVCTVKCAKGCTGADCFCGSFDPADYVATPDAAASYPLCVSATECKEHCSDVDSCVGFDYDPEKSMCTLLSGNCTDLEFLEGSEFWSRVANTSACEVDADYTVPVGKVTLTERAEIGVDWVLTPGETASIEVIGSDMDWKSDRLMIIDCTGICGISGPTEAIMAGPKSQMHFNHWVAVPPEDGPDSIDDPPSDDMEVAKPIKPEEPEETVFWREVEGSYCAGNNMDVLGVKEAERHQCYAKCVTGPECTDDDCFCDGLMQGYDGPESQALCLDADACKDVCAELDDCFGIDMHGDKPRCFLNGMIKGPSDPYSCEEYVVNGKLTSGDFVDYDFFYKQLPNTRRAKSLEPEAPTRSLLPAIDKGESWDEILRFTNITFESGGKFKACFCDSDTLETTKDGKALPCKKATDYKIEIGTIHVSGVSCLVEEPKFQRGTCVGQFYGGLRCYPGAAPKLEVPKYPDAGVTQKNAPPAPVFDPALSSFCLYGPEEETRDDPLCNL